MVDRNRPGVTDMAQAGGPDGTKADAALAAVESITRLTIS